MRRSKMSQRGEQIVTEALDMHYGRDWFIETSPEFIEFAEKGKAQARAEGEILGRRQAIINIVRIRFPQLEDFTQQQVTKLGNPDQLNTLMQQLITSSDEENARTLLSS